MKITICILTLLGCSLAMPSAEVFDLSQIDWSKVKRIESFMEPLPNAKPSNVETRVVGGTEATPHSIPYQVAVLSNGATLCGGSLISPEWVLSAAHCTISATFVQVILGAHNIVNIEPTQVVVSSNDIINHPEYDSSTLLNDISVVHLPSRVTLTNAIHVIDLAPVNSGSFADETALLSGWGSTYDSSSSSATLRRVSLTVITNAECQNTFGSIIQPSTLCTSGAGRVGVCSGDSGGPLVVDNVQVGVVSFAGSSCEGGLPSGYVRISSLRAWINSVTGV